MRRRRKSTVDIPTKANRILKGVFIALVLIAMRCWHLSVIQHDERAETASRPQQRVVIEPAKRGTIRDRFNRPLAINKVQYQAAVLYSELRQIPAAIYETNADGKRVRRFKRREYITKLAQLLGDELQQDPERIEDLIHAKASFYYHLPFVLKKDISETQYYRLKLLEKDWPGIHVQQIPRREYPQGMVAADIVGYMGAISREEYEAFIQEKKTLEAYIDEREAGGSPDLPEGIASPQEAWERLQELERRAYRVTDYVGKMGIESSFEDDLRGFHGKKSYYSDARGNFLRELPGAEEPLSGKRILLTISSELQAYAEGLLADDEKNRSTRISGVPSSTLESLGIPDPWIRGGAVIAMDANTGEVLAMASHPGYDSNDFMISGNAEVDKVKRANILRWFETDAFIGDVWDQKRPYERHGEEKMLTWSVFLDHALPKNHCVRKALEKRSTIADAVTVQRHVDDLLTLSCQNQAYWLFNALYDRNPHITHRKAMPAVARDDLEENFETHASQIDQIKRNLDPYLQNIPLNYDKVLLVDLYRLTIDEKNVSQRLLDAVGHQSLFDYRETSAAFIELNQLVKAMAKDLFHHIDFKQWRETHAKAFLKDKRTEEKRAKKYTQPYIDLLDKKEREDFEHFWEDRRWDLMMTFLHGVSKDNDPYSRHFLSWYQELSQGAHKALSWRSRYEKLQHETHFLPPESAVEYMQTMRSFDELNRPLLGKYSHTRKENGKQFEKHLAAAFYPLYGFGHGRSHAFRQATTQGSIFKIVVAYAALVQRYRELEGVNITPERLNPLTIDDQMFKDGKEIYMGHHANGKPIPKHYNGGTLIRSMSQQIGRTDLVNAIAKSSNVYFSLLAGDVLNDPNDLINAAQALSFGHRTGIDLPTEIAGRLPNDLDLNRTGLYATAIGQHSLVVTPLQTATMMATLANGGEVLKPQIVNLTVGKDPNHPDCHLIQSNTKEVVNTLFIPDAVRSVLLDGMHRVTKSVRKRCRAPAVEGVFVGKTSTAESVEHTNLDLKYGSNTYNHTWFGGIAFDQDKTPEIVVVVYLRYGSYGKDAYPIAAKMVNKWREISAISGH